MSPTATNSPSSDTQVDAGEGEHRVSEDRRVLLDLDGDTRWGDLRARARLPARGVGPVPAMLCLRELAGRAQIGQPRAALGDTSRAWPTRMEEAVSRRRSARFGPAHSPRYSRRCSQAMRRRKRVGRAP